jgi:hypothetical protein
VNLNLEFDQAIAERTIEAREGRNIVVTLGMPRVEDKIGGWVCPYRIEGLPGEPNYRMFGGGTDSVHTIIAALANLGAYLNYRWKDGAPRRAATAADQLVTEYRPGSVGLTRLEHCTHG